MKKSFLLFIPLIFLLIITQTSKFFGADEKEKSMPAIEDDSLTSKPVTNSVSKPPEDLLDDKRKNLAAIRKKSEGRSLH